MEEKNTVVEKQLVVFNLGKESYAVDIDLVREIIHLQEITQVPGLLRSIEGVINLRGSVIPTVDLRKRFGLPAVERNNDSRIVVVNCCGNNIGVIVDAVAEVLRIPVDSIEATDNLFTGEKMEYLKGIVKLTGRLIILLDMNAVLSNEELTMINSESLLKSEEAVAA